MSNERYVAFVDILGFKEMVKKSKSAAKDTIRKFSKLIYDSWSSLGFDLRNSVNGFIVSDCAIIHTVNTQSEHLKNLLTLLIDIFPKAIFSNGFMLRGAITKGEFEEIPSQSFQNLSKRLIVGEAYVNATILESKYKGSKIVFNNEINDDIKLIDNSIFDTISLDDSNKDNDYELQWAKETSLDDDENMSEFVKMANESEWLIHYYETLHNLLRVVKKKPAQTSILDKIWEKLGDYTNKDHFIMNAMDSKVNHRFKQIILKYIRDKIDVSFIGGAK